MRSEDAKALNNHELKDELFMALEAVTVLMKEADVRLNCLPVLNQAKSASGMKRIYVAGAYSAPSSVEMLNNMRRGMRASVELLLQGFAPFCPWLDYHFQLLLRDGESLSVEDYYNYSLAWLDAAHAVLVMPYSEKSVGTKAEVERAAELGIPIYHSMEDLCSHEKTID